MYLPISLLIDQQLNNYSSTENSMCVRYTMLKCYVYSSIKADCKATGVGWHAGNSSFLVLLRK